VIDSENPSNFGLPVQWPSEAITTESPILKLAWMILFSAPGGVCAGSGDSL
jgi:hypothetical protein